MSIMHPFDYHSSQDMHLFCLPIYHSIYPLNTCNCQFIYPLYFVQEISMLYNNYHLSYLV